MNVILMIFCYIYVFFIIFVSSKLRKRFHVSKKTSRKFLHVMIGNLPFIVPFFTSHIYPVLVAAPFILVTFLASPYSKVTMIRNKLRGLADMTEEGHHLGLVFYTVSYTFLAIFFSSKPYVIAAGILPMAYGDSAAAIIGEKYGRRRYKLVSEKSVEGSAAMFFTSFVGFTLGLLYFSGLYSFLIFESIVGAFAVATAATLVESVSPMGFDNLTVPAVSVVAFLLFNGG